MPVPGPEGIVAIASRAAFGRRRVTNVVRALLVEAMVSSALPPEWEWCAADYASFDFRHSSGIRLEVKQSAALQSWPSAPSKPRWDIAARQGYWDGPIYTKGPGRNAEIYVLAHHPETDEAIADHRDPPQWLFFVIDVRSLPAEAKTIGSSSVFKLAQAVGIDDLANAVEAVRTSCRSRTAAPA